MTGAGRGGEQLSEINEEEFGGAKVMFLPTCLPSECGSQVTFPGLTISGTYLEVAAPSHAPSSHPLLTCPSYPPRLRCPVLSSLPPRARR